MESFERILFFDFFTFADTLRPESSHRKETEGNIGGEESSKNWGTRENGSWKTGERKLQS